MEILPLQKPKFLEDVDIDHILESNKVVLERKIINTSLVTWMITIKLNHSV